MKDYKMQLSLKNYKVIKNEDVKKKGKVYKVLQD